MKGSMKSGLQKVAVAAAGVAFAMSASAAGMSALFGKHDVPMPMSVSESAPWRAADRQTTDPKGVGATHNEAVSEQRGGSAQRSGSSHRSSTFPSSVDESAPWLTGR